MKHGIVVASYGRQFVVRAETDGSTYTAVTRGKRRDVAVGDRVMLGLLGAGQAVIDRVEPRRNEFKRSDTMRTKMLAANLDQAAIVIASEPAFSEELLVRVLMAAEAENIPMAIVVNKHDLAESRARIEPRIAVYRALGYPVFDCSAASDPGQTRALLRPWLEGRTTLLLGESGMGKSTLVNCLVPDAQLRTQAISDFLGSGRHTTTFCRLFDLPDDLSGGKIIDSPGFQNFGLDHLSESERVHAMPEFRPLLGRCRFYNCTHRSEPGCAIRDASERPQGRASPSPPPEGVKEAWGGPALPSDLKAIDARRYRIFVRLAEEAIAIAKANPDRG